MPPPATCGEFGHGVALRIGVAHVEVLDGPEDVEKVFMGKRGRIEPSSADAGKCSTESSFPLSATAR